MKRCRISPIPSAQVTSSSEALRSRCGCLVHPIPAGVPVKVGPVLEYIDKYQRPPEGHVGGRPFGNYEGLQPKKDARGRSIKYQEWDVNPRMPGKNRGPERLVTGSDGSAYYTADHYRSFIKIR